jgi:hypothetical protein
MQPTILITTLTYLTIITLTITPSTIQSIININHQTRRHLQNQQQQPCNTYTTPSQCAKANNPNTGGCTWVISNKKHHGTTTTTTGRCMKACGYTRQNAHGKCQCDPNGITHIVGRPKKDWWGAVFAVDFSSSEKIFALGYPIQGIHVFSTSTYERTNIIPLDQAETFRFSNKIDTFLASAYTVEDPLPYTHRQHVSMINTTSGFVYPPLPGGGSSGFFNEITFSSDGKLLGLCAGELTPGDYAGYVRVLSSTNYVNWELVHDIELKGPCKKALFSPIDSNLLATFNQCMPNYPTGCKDQNPEGVVGGFDFD